MATSYTLDNFLKAEEETARKTLRHFRKEFKRYERSFNMLMEIFCYLTDYTKSEKSFGSTAKDTVILVAARIIHSIQSMRNLVLRGYYYDASVLERSLIESMCLCAYLALDEKEAKNWLKGKNPNIAKIKLLDYVSILLKVKGVDAKSDYGELCQFVHTGARSVMSLVDFSYLPEEVGLRLLPELNRERVSDIASYPILVLLMLKTIFHAELTEKAREEIDRLVRQRAQYLSERKTKRNKK